jgi:hypothetical protein
MAYNVEKHVFTDKTFYQTKNFVSAKTISEEIQKVTDTSQICNQLPGTAV